MLSPARPSSRILRNISTPLHPVFWVGRIPMISTSSPVWMIPCSTLPVTTVPRPVIENTSSIGIWNGLSKSRTRSRTYESNAPPHSSTCPGAAPSIPHRLGPIPLAPRHQLLHLRGRRLITLQRLQRRHPHHRNVVTRELVLRKE